MVCGDLLENNLVNKHAVLQDDGPVRGVLAVRQLRPGGVGLDTARAPRCQHADAEHSAGEADQDL